MNKKTDVDGAASECSDLLGGSRVRPRPLIVKIRRGLRPVKPEAEQLDGKTFLFVFGWIMGDDDPYPGEAAWIPKNDGWPDDAPIWLASGDLVPPNTEFSRDD